MVLFTATVVLAFFFVALLAIFLGKNTDHIELFWFGVVILMFMGLSVIDNGLAVQSGELISFNETVTGNVTSQERTVEFVYDQNINILSNGIGILAVLIAAGLSLTWKSARDKGRRRKKDGMDFDDF